jgi:multiple sugar transport system substrate-binding protein
MKHPFRLLGIAGASALLVAAGSFSALAQSPSESPAAPAAPVSLTYFTFSAAPDHLQDLNAIVTAFEAQHPNITINVETADYADYFTKLQTAVAGGTAPDTFELDYQDFVSYASAGSLLDISSQAAPIASTYYPNAYNVFALDSKQYGLPESFSDVLLFYNKDLFDAAGVAYPTPDWKWADELDAAKKLTNASTGVWGDFQPVQFYEFYKVLAQNGGSFFNADKTQATFNDDKGVAAANWLIEKANTDHVMPTTAELGGQDDTALFKSGKLAMWHNGIWQFSGLKDAPFKWDVQLEPGNVQKAHHFFANAVVASANTAHPDEAFQWLSFLTGSPDAVKTRLDASWELPAVADQSQFQSYLTQTPPDNREAVFQALDNIVVPPVIEQESQLQDIVTNALASAQSGQASVQDALNSAADQVNALLQ